MCYDISFSAQTPSTATGINFRTIGHDIRNLFCIKGNQQVQEQHKANNQITGLQAEQLSSLPDCYQVERTTTSGKEFFWGITCDATGDSESFMLTATSQRDPPDFTDLETFNIDTFIQARHTIT